MSLTWHEQERKRRRDAIEAIPEFMMAFKNQNIKKAELEYRGYGDSGDAWEWTFYDKDNNTLDINSWYASKKQDKQFDTLGIDKAALNTFDNHIENLLTYDWVNNEGGGGTIHFDFDNLSINIKAYYVERVDRDASDMLETEYNFNESS